MEQLTLAFPIEKELKAGVYCTHKQTGQRLKVKKVYTHVATCYLSQPLEISNRLSVYVCVCKIETLKII